MISFFAGLVSESFDTIGVNRTGREVRRYEYHLTDRGRERLVALGDAYSSEISKLEELIVRLRDTVGSFDQRPLSAAAKVHFIQDKEGRSLNDDEIQEMAENRGWNLTGTQIGRVRNVLGNVLVEANDGSSS